MLTEIFRAVRQTYRDTQKIVGSLARNFSVAACPDAALPDLRKCYDQTDIVIAQTRALLSYKTVELCDLADLFEIRDDFGRFSDLMAFWEGIGSSYDGEEEKSTQRIEVICEAARKFNLHFKKLPPLVRGMTDIGLSLHKDLIVGLIEQGATEYVTTLER